MFEAYPTVSLKKCKCFADLGHHCYIYTKRQSTTIPSALFSDDRDKPSQLKTVPRHTLRGTASLMLQRRFNHKELRVEASKTVC